MPSGPPLGFAAPMHRSRNGMATVRYRQRPPATSHCAQRAIRNASSEGKRGNPVLQFAYRPFAVTLVVALSMVVSAGPAHAAPGSQDPRLIVLAPVATGVGPSI